LGIDHLQVELDNGNQLVLPLWMFDAEVCKSMVVRAHPVIAVAALLTLRSLLDSQPLLVNHGSTTSGASSTEGGRIEPAKTTAVPVRHTKARTS
jgi:hypothetical protein